MNFIDFNRPTIVGKELEYIQDAILNRKTLCGNGYYTKKCSELLEKELEIKRALLTTSCSSALEMAAILTNLGPGDEVIVPSFTFVTTVNSFVLRGARPVFADIRTDTLNIDESRIESLITSKTKAIFVVHYAGISAEMDEILRIARKHNLFVVEDAAQAMDSFYKAKPAGTLGDLGAFSFHETKNYICGEGGALLVNNKQFVERAEVVLEKGTNRKKFMEGMVDKYTWVDVGSSYVLSELNAAFLYGQLECKETILKKRLDMFNRYSADLSFLQSKGIQLPYVPEHCTTNGHMFYILCTSHHERSALMQYLRESNIQAVFHYIPLNSSPMGNRITTSGNLPITEDVSKRLLRLPMHFGLGIEEQAFVIEKVGNFYEH